MSDEVKIEKVIVEIDGEEVVLTIEQLKKLKTAILAILPEPVYYPYYIWDCTKPYPVFTPSYGSNTGMI